MIVLILLEFLVKLESLRKVQHFASFVYTFCILSSNCSDELILGLVLLMALVYFLRLIIQYVIIEQAFLNLPLVEKSMFSLLPQAIAAVDLTSCHD